MNQDRLSNSPTRADIESAQTIIMSGGGNRCWWQAGLLDRLRAAGLQLPDRYLGTSAGAGIAAMLATDTTENALDDGVRRFAANPSNFDWRRIVRGERPFPMPGMYANWLAAFLTPAAFAALKHSQREVWVAITRPPRVVPVGLSVTAAVGIYLGQKFVVRRLHSKVFSRMGFRSELFRLNDCVSPAEAVALLMATIATPPITGVARHLGRPALDGGFHDHTPVPRAADHGFGRLLILLTRHYRQYPPLFRLADRVYLQPSERVPVSNWAATARTDLRAAYALGSADAERVLSTLS